MSKQRLLDFKSCELPLLKLPRISDLIKGIYFEKESRNISTGDAIKIVADKTCDLWQRTSIPILSGRSVVRQISVYLEKHAKLSKAEKNLDISSKINIQAFKLSSNKLFDIALCKCDNLRKCNCSDEDKIPLTQQQFVVDQRSGRKMLLSFTSLPAQTEQNKRKRLQSPNQSNDSANCNESASSGLDSSSITESSSELQTSTKCMNLRSRFIECSYKTGEEYNTVKLLEVAKTADRYNIGDRVAAALATATLIDFKIVSAENRLLVVDRNKVLRGKRRLREKQINHLTFDEIQGLYFDGRKDKTIEFKDNAKKTVKEEHISFVQQPNSFFVGHKAVADGRAVTIADSVEDLLDDKEIPFSKINTIGCDGTVVNTGYDGGIIRILEERWQKALLWVICMLHLIELPLRALMTKLDGPTSGSKSFSGPLGKRLKDCVKNKIVKFTPIKFECSVPNIDTISDDLSTDQKYLFEMCTAISKGYVSSQLASRSIGPLNHSRWTTLANRLLRMYVSDTKPSLVLKTLVKYIMFVYAPAIFQIKYKSSVVFGSVHLAEIVKSCRFLSKKARNIVENSIQWNGYFSHPEHITLAMLNDDDEKIRKRGWINVLHARESKSESDPVRLFEIPEINFYCTSYLDLIDMENEYYTDPPILREINVNEGNIDYLASKKIIEHDFGNFLKHMPSHTQPVERCVKLVTEASKMTCGEKGRDGLIANTLASRNVMKKFNSKKDFGFNENILTNLKV